MKTKQKTEKYFHLPLAPTTTEQQDLMVAGQRRINLIWEYTQSVVAILVVATNMIVAIIFVMYKLPSNDYPFILSASFFLVVGAYFQRTNHQNVGGIGRKRIEDQQYVGR